MLQYASKPTQLSQTVAWESYRLQSAGETETTRVALRLEGGLLTLAINDVVHTVGLPPEVSDAIVDMFAAQTRFAPERRDLLLVDRATTLAIAQQLRPEALADEITRTKQAIAEHDEMLQRDDAADLQQVAESLRANLRFMETAYAALRRST